MLGLDTSKELKAQKFNFATFWQNVSELGKKNYKLGEKSDFGVWAETINPLRGLTEQKARDIFDQARQGVYADLTYLYQEIEAADPTLLTCTEKREAVTGASDWRIVTSNPERVRGYEENLANEQKQYLYQAFGMAQDEIGGLAEHLERGFFRGFAHARPIYEADGVVGFEFYDQWNFALDKYSGQWWWNPDASGLYTSNFRPIPDGELISLVRQRHVDYAALLPYIRQALGEKKYGVFLERYGIPPVTIIMPQSTDKNDTDKYFEAAEKLARAGTGALPFGSQVNYATEARGTNPFLEFLRHQQELIVLMSTGGTMTSLASPTGIGSGASEVQERGWRQIVSRDIRSSGRSINRSVTRKLLRQKFPGFPMLAMFEFDPDPAPTAKEVFEDAAAAKTGGYLIDKKQLEDASGYTLVLAPELLNAQQIGNFPAPILNKAVEPIAKPLQNDSKLSDASAHAKTDQTQQGASGAILAALAKDMSGAGKAVADLLAITDHDKLQNAAADLIKRLPKLLPEDPEMVAVFEDALATSFVDSATEQKA